MKTPPERAESNPSNVRPPGEAPLIRKLGTLDCDMVETTPIVFRDRLYRFEYVRPDYKANESGRSYFRFVEVKTGDLTPPFAAGYHLGCAYCERDTVYVYGVDIWGGTEIRCFQSSDLTNWTSRPALVQPNWGMYNTSVCKAEGRYVMAIELGEPPEEVGTRFTMRFAASNDLLDWHVLPRECVFSRDRYTACPAIRFLDGQYHMIYLEARPGPTYEAHIVRSPDLIHWESSPFNPVLRHSAQDKLIGNRHLTADERVRIAHAANCNNSDVDLCEYGGRVVIYYSWGNQRGIEHLAHAAYDGTLADFLRAFFPEG